MRRRLRPLPSPEELGRIYATPHKHTEWVDHRLRVAVTVDVAKWMAPFVDKRAVADLSCGDGTIVGCLPEYQQTVLGDFAPGYEYTGPIEETIQKIPDVDLFINTETLEHVDDPDLVLHLIRKKSRGLVLSTPVDAFDDANLEHLWAWSRRGVEEMLTRAGFSVTAYATVDLRPTFVYCFGIWGCT